MHIKETDLELFAYRPESFSEEENNNILSHLEHCNLCKDIYNTYINIYSAINSGLEKESDENDKELAQKIVNKFEDRQYKKLLPESKTSVQIYDSKVEIVTKPKFFSLQYFVYMAKHYPVQSIGFALVAVLALMFFMNNWRTSVKDDNPVFAEMSNGTLNIHNALGEILWKKPGYELPQIGRDSLMTWLHRMERHVNILDIDGDGKNEVIITGSVDAKYTFRCDSLYCFDYKGTKLWTAHTESEKTNYAPRWKRTGWVIRDFFTAKYKDKQRLYLIANDKSYGGSVISEIDIKTGEVLASIYHSGWPTAQLCVDLDNDGIEELLIGCVSSYVKASLIVLHQDHLKGVLPDSYSNYSMPKDEALYYILFPISDAHKFLKVFVSENSIAQLQKSDNFGIMIQVVEGYLKDLEGYPDISVQYLLDREMKIIAITPGSAIEQLVQRGILDNKFRSDEYWSSLKDSIQYWNGDKFVDYPTKNKYWIQNPQLPE